MFERTAGHRIALTQRPIVLHDELGHHEQRYAPAAFRRVRRLGEDEVDDILGQVLLA